MAKRKSNVLLATGDDDFTAHEAVKKAIAAAVPEEYRSTAVEIVDGVASNAESQMESIRRCTDSVLTPPFLEPVKFTWWKDVSFLPGGGRGGVVAAEVKEALERFAETVAKGLPENQFLAITAPKLLKTSIFAKRMREVAETIETSMPAKSRDRAAAALAKLPDLAREEGLTFAPGADRAFTAKVGPDVRRLKSELAKMRTYLGDGRSEATIEDVAAIASPGGDDLEIWELTDALAARNPARVLAVLRNFQGDSGWPIMATTVIEKWFRELLLAKSGGGGDDWRSRRMASAAAGFTMNEIIIARSRMLKLRERLVTSQPGGDYVEMEILRTIVRRVKAPGAQSAR